MYSMDALKAIAEKKEMPLKEIGLKMGLSRQYIQTVASKGSNPRSDTFSKMLDVCGYKLCAVPKGQTSDSTLVID